MTIQALKPESVVERMIAELNANPEVRRLLLRALLTDEFLMLPARVERIEEDVSDLKAGQAELRAGQDELRAGQDEVRAGQDELRAGQDELRAGQDELRKDVDLLKSGQSRMEGQIGNLRGGDYERRMLQNIVTIARHNLDMDDVYVLKGDRPERVNELGNKVNDAQRRRLITREQGNELLWTDAVVSGVRELDGSPVHAVVEVSITIGESDIIRAAERAATLAAVMGEPAMGAVIGERISDPDRRRAERENVLVTIIRFRQ